MTSANDPSSPVDPDELATGWVDGMLEPAERARVAADADLRARAEVHAAVRDAIAAPGPVASAAERDAAIAAALAAADPVVVPLAAHRARRRWLPAAAAVAAAVLVVAGLAVWSSGRHGTTSRTETALPPSTAAAAAPGTAATSGGAGGAAADSSGAFTVGDLGTLSSDSDVRAAVAARLPQAAGGSPAAGGATAAPSSAAGAASAGNPDSVPAVEQPPLPAVTAPKDAGAGACTPPSGVLVARYAARWQGRPVTALVLAPAPGAPPAKVLLVDPNACSTVHEVTLP